MPIDSPNTDVTHRRVIFHGRVQGVGFRYTTQSLSRQFRVGGYVKNLADGTVELVVSGAKAEIDGLLGAIQSRFDGHISSVEVESIEDRGFSANDGVSIRR